MSEAQQSGRRGDQLIEQILTDQTEFGASATELLSEFWHGYPITELRRLLTATGSSQVFTGVSLASELGEQGRPVFEYVIPLLWHPYEKVRYYAVDFVSATALPTDRAALATVLTLLDDPAASVRYAVIKFLFDVPPDILTALKKPPQDSRLADGAQQIGLSLITDAVDAHDLVRIRRGLDDDSSIVRRFAVAAAARLVPFDGTILEQAAHSSDGDLTNFATRTLSRTRPRPRRELRPN
jgi:hypothetical protein